MIRRLFAKALYECNRFRRRQEKGASEDFFSAFVRTFTRRPEAADKFRFDFICDTKGVPFAGHIINMKNEIVRTKTLRSWLDAADWLAEVFGGYVELPTENRNRKKKE